MELDVVKVVLSVLCGALAGAWGTWVTEPKRQQNALELALANHRLAEQARQQEAAERAVTLGQDHANELAKLRSEHDLALQAKEREVLQALAAGYAADLRERRIDAYKDLWKRLEVFALYQPAEDVTYAELEPFAVGLREWYFSLGGLLLSTEARNAYFAVQDAVVRARRAAEKNSLTGPLRTRSESFTLTEADEQDRIETAWEPGTNPKRDYFEIRRQTSALRSKLCDDLGTRARPLVGHS